MSTAAAKTSLLPRWMISEHPFPWLLPASALMVIFGLYPLLYAIWLSLQRKHPVTRKLTLAPTYNWSKLLGDERVWNALGNTLVYTGAALLLQLVLGMADRAAARFGPQGLRTPARHDDPAAGDPARRHRHDVSAHAQRLLRGAGARHHRHRAAAAGLLHSGHRARPPWPACCWPRSGNGRPSWC